MKLLYISVYNKKYNYKFYIYNLLNKIYNIYNIYIKKIKKEYYYNNKKNIINIINKYIDKINNNYYYQYEEVQIIKYILYLNIINKIKFNFFKNNNINFLFNLYKITKKKNNKIIKIIKKNIINWDINRINLIEIIILKMAISEFFFIRKNEKKFINIIISEYINIINIFSSIKSKYFINGILDNIFKKYNYVKKNKIK
ncbi:MAG: hypothetical protein NHG00_00635 [Candidatus Shikimatogenerans sp. JK-2022]|nr:hypothetical protein [Candidatus Shikimatogenerans bostrichidophilus]